MGGFFTNVQVRVGDRPPDLVRRAIINDSDILYLPLFENERPVDRYVSDPEYFGPIESSKKQAQAGHADRWAGLLVDGIRPDRLRTIWDTQNIFAEDLLKQVAQAIGLSTKSCLVGFNSLGSEGRDSEILTKLSFRRTRPSSAEAAEMFMLLGV